MVCCVVIEVNKDGLYRVNQVVESYECGAILNPRITLAQVEGAIFQGLGGALRKEMRFENGKVLNGRFSEYSVPRLQTCRRSRVYSLTATTSISRRGRDADHRSGSGDCERSANKNWFDADSKRADQIRVEVYAKFDLQ